MCRRRFEALPAPPRRSYLSFRTGRLGESGFAPRIVLNAVAGVDYRFELRRGDEVIATGHLNHEQPLEVGDRIEIGGQFGMVRTIAPTLGEREMRLVVDLLPDRV